MNKISSPDPFGMKPLWNAILEVYEVFDAICGKYGLRHFALGGTAIGALRHKGFIPWDDDFDVGMPRPDYEKFLSIIERELPTNLKLVNWKNTRELGCPFSKIQETRKEYVEGIEERCGFTLSNGVYIDVFPVDGDKRPGSFGRKMMRFRLKTIAALERFHGHRFSEQSKMGKIGWLFGMILSPFCPLLRTDRQCMEAFENIMKSNLYRDDARTFVVGRGLTYYIPSEKINLWKEMKYVPFEKVSVAISTRCAELLHEQFGDYMKLPPESERHPLHSFSYHCPWWLGPTDKKLQENS